MKTKDLYIYTLENRDREIRKYINQLEFLSDNGLKITEALVHVTLPNFLTQKNLLIDRNAILLKKIDKGVYRFVLSSSDTVYEKYLNLERLVPFERVINKKGNVSKKQAVNLFNNRLSQRFPVKNFYIGNIEKVVKEVKNKKTAIKITHHLVKEEALLLREENNFTDLETFLTYSSSINGEGEIIAEEERLNKYLELKTDKDKEIEIYKVLEKYRKEVY